MAELGHLRDHQGVEEPALRCRAPPEGQGEPGSAPGLWPAQEYHERVLRAVIRAGRPDRGPEWPAFLEGGAVLRVTDAEANVWLPRALAHRPQPLALPLEEPAAAAAPARRQPKPDDNGLTPGTLGPRPQTASTWGWERTDGPGHHPRQAPAPRM